MSHQNIYSSEKVAKEKMSTTFYKQSSDYGTTGKLVALGEKQKLPQDNSKDNSLKGSVRLSMQEQVQLQIT